MPFASLLVEESSGQDRSLTILSVSNSAMRTILLKFDRNVREVLAMVYTRRNQPGQPGLPGLRNRIKLHILTFSL